MPKSKSTKMIVMRKTKSKYRHNANVSIQKQIGMSNKQIVKLRYLVTLDLPEVYQIYENFSLD